MGPPAWRVSWPGGTTCFSRVSSNSAWNRVGIGDAPADDPAAEDVENDVEIEVRSVMLMPSLICLLGAVDAINRASLQFRETGEGVVGIREQEAVGGRVADNGDCPVANAPFNPIARDLQPPGQFGHGQPARDVAGVGLSLVSQHAVVLPDMADRFHGDMSASSRAITLTGQPSGSSSRPWRARSRSRASISAPRVR